MTAVISWRLFLLIADEGGCYLLCSNAKSALFWSVLFNLNSSNLLLVLWSDKIKKRQFLATGGTGNTFLKANFTYDGILNLKGEVKLAIALSPRPFSGPTAQNLRSQVGLHIGATVLFQDPKQTYEIKGCGLGVCASVRVCKIGCSI